LQIRLCAGKVEGKVGEATTHLIVPSHFAHAAHPGAVLRAVEAAGGIESLQDCYERLRNGHLKIVAQR